MDGSQCLKFHVFMVLTEYAATGRGANRVVDKWDEVDKVDMQGPTWTMSKPTLQSPSLP